MCNCANDRYKITVELIEIYFAFGLTAYATTISYCYTSWIYAEITIVADIFRVQMTWCLIIGSDVMFRFWNHNHNVQRQRGRNVFVSHTKAMYNRIIQSCNFRRGAEVGMKDPYLFSNVHCDGMSLLKLSHLKYSIPPLTKNSSRPHLWHVSASSHEMIGAK